MLNARASLDLLIKIKPGLSANKLDVGSILDDLSEVAALAEAFTAQRPRSKKNWVQFADALDREGACGHPRAF